jgi:FtsH-binding integral membrane protein
MGQATHMDKGSTHNDLRYANWALVFLVAGLLVLIVALAVGYSAWQAGNAAVNSILELLPIIGLFLSPALEGVALVLGIIGRRHVRGQNAVAGAIFLLLVALLGFCLSFGLLMDHVKLIFV